MGTSLTGLTPSTTYDALIKVGDNGPITSTLKTLSDGLGNDLPMEASTTAVNFTGTLTQGGATLQPTLVSGTNIKTINGTSVLGAGNIVTPSTNPSGVAGAIQFSNGSAFASDATNLFWDDTNNRLGIGTNAPTATAHIVGANTSSSSYSVKVLSSVGQGIFSVTNDGYTQIGDFSAQGYGSFLAFLRPSGGTRVTTFNQGNSNLTITNTNGNVTYQNTPVQVVGSGSTSATTSLLVQNSAGTAAMTVKDDLSTTFGGTVQAGNLVATANINFGNILYGTAFFSQNTGATTIGASAAADASAMLDIRSTTRGFLPPRMTTTQKNAIASPVAGLVVYDNTTNKLQCYNGSTWNDLF